MTLAVAAGDPAGVGPEVAVAAAVERAPLEPILVFGDADQLERLARGQGFENTVRLSSPEGAAMKEGHFGLVHVADGPEPPGGVRGPTKAGGVHQLAVLEAAAQSVQAGHARALVTGPVSKAAVQLGGTAFVGQTEHLAHLAGLRPDAVTMLFLGRRLRVALVTTHLAVRQVPEALTELRIVRTACHLGDALLRLSGLPRPVRVSVAGFNPHAGEGGLFGDEEVRLIAPAIETARRRRPFESGAAVLGDLVPTETALRSVSEGASQGAVMMMHDQATIACKLLEFGVCVNVTWGLPFVRTSVDHGVAYDAAGAGTASASGMLAAIDMARQLAPGNRHAG